MTIKWIKAIQNIGTGTHTNLLEVKRIKMLNHVAMIQMIIYTIFTVVSLIISPDIAAWGPNGLGIIICSGPLLLNFSHKHTLAKLYSCSFIPLFITFCVFIWGPEKQTQNYILFHSILPVLLFDRLRQKIWLWLFNVFTFSICLTFPLYHQPIYANSSWHMIGVLNNYALFIGFLIFIIFNENSIAFYISEIKQANNRLKESYHSIDRIHRSQKQLNFIISHDLKNYMGILQSIINMYINNKDSFSASHQETILLEIKKIVDTSNELVNNLMDLSKNRTGNIEETHLRFNLNSLLTDVKKQLRPFIDQKQIHINTNIGDRIQIYGNPNAYMTLLRNLILNAVKFSERDSSIDVMFDQDDWNYNFRVADQGIGLTEEDRSKLFQKETNYREIGNSKEKGTGLGLSICNEIVRLYKGEISAEHNNPKGCIFQFTLPIESELSIQNIQVG